MTSPPASNWWRRLEHQIFWVAAVMVVLAWALTAQAQQQKQQRVQQPAQQEPQQQARRPLRIGVLNAAWAASHPTVEGLKAGLRELGLEDGRDVTFDIRFTEGKLN